MIKNHLQNYFEEVKRFTRGVSESIAKNYDTALENFFFNSLHIRPETDYPYYNIEWKKYNAMLFIKDTKRIREHLKTENNSTLPIQLRIFSKPADDIVIEFWNYSKDSKWHKDYLKLREKKENNINSNSKYISANLDDILWSDIKEFRKNLEKLFKKSGINIYELEPEPEPIPEPEPEAESDIETETIDPLYDTHLFHKETWLHKRTLQKYNLLWYDKTWKNEDGIHITDF